MHENLRILAVVPARGGSKGVPLKNIKLLAGLPLIAHTARVIQQVPRIDRAVVSTDHTEIARIATEHGLACLGPRPDDLSGDRISDLPVLQHALEQAEAADGCRYDIILMLQPTSPLRLPEDIDACIDKLVADGHDAVWTVSPIDLKFHPLKVLRIDEGKLDLWDSRGHQIIARQQLEPLYYRNGICYAFTRSCLMETCSIYGTHAGACIVNHAFVNIDTESDFQTAETLLTQS
ncbi:acylneuraminate cytidylyltransferase family protein [Prosthecobacter sp.]|uniref:acylneuraminate cytidylyltransferase family protein n=1 Tax=Prosthecobacter sp. TaxID=1965333 RepID=UPI002AB9EB7C|nr:acylneuraminate cytidylyltransferase family protein [Prosthecobacter sp.]MDZ4405804.1 acylneuraminate cytidylyltransferase family protein [Prosthecobacter sp.]